MTFDDYRPLVFEGLGATVLITVLSLILGTLLGGVIYVMSMNRRRWMREFSKGYHYIVRGVPLMVLLQLAYISSSGLRIFLSILKTAKAKGSHVYITGANEDINKVFAMTGFNNLFEFR